MHKLIVPAPELVQAFLRQEAERSPQARLLHRLHCVLLVGAGWPCHQVAALFGDDPRTVQRWVRKVEAAGIDGLRERTHSGRHAALSAAQMGELACALEAGPPQAWNGTLLRAEIGRRFGVSLSARHCQRLHKRLLASPKVARWGPETS
ncbi:transposase [Oxalobacteraceae bacterium GrIS 1.11]